MLLQYNCKFMSQSNCTNAACVLSLLSPLLSTSPFPSLHFFYAVGVLCLPYGGRHNHWIDWKKLGEGRGEKERAILSLHLFSYSLPSALSVNPCKSTTTYLMLNASIDSNWLLKSLLPALFISTLKMYIQGQDGYCLYIFVTSRKK